MNKDFQVFYKDQVELLEPTQYTNEDDLNLSELISRQNKQFKKQLAWRQAFDETLIDTNITRMEEDWKQLTRKFVEEGQNILY